jgi:IS4 transposase
VSYYDAESDKRPNLLTNNFTLPALTIAQIYKCRWQVELFFNLFQMDQAAPADQGLILLNF